MKTKYLNFKKITEIIRIYSMVYDNWPIALFNLIVKDKTKAKIKHGPEIYGSRKETYRLARFIVSLIMLYSREPQKICIKYINKKSFSYLYDHNLDESTSSSTSEFHSLDNFECYKILVPIDNWKDIAVELNDKKMVLKEWYRSDILSQVFWYGFLHVKDRSVLDIGGYIGDSALIFSFSGAKKVVSVEVSPWAINVAKENIMLNNVQNKVHLINCAIDDNDGNTLFIRDGETDIADSLNTLVVSEKHGIPVNTCTFDNLIEKYGPFDILKMDCEGCEYKAMLNSYNIDKFKEIILEYHNGNETLSEMLKSKGFKIYYLDYIIGTKLSKKPYNSKIGILYAIKD